MPGVRLSRGSGRNPVPGLRKAPPGSHLARAPAAPSADGPGAPPGEPPHAGGAPVTAPSPASASSALRAGRPVQLVRRGTRGGVRVLPTVRTTTPGSGYRTGPAADSAPAR